MNRVEKLAKLAKMTLSIDEVDRLEEEIERLIHFVDQIENYQISNTTTGDHLTEYLLRSDDHLGPTANNVDCNSWQMLPKNFRVKRVLG